jgi:hypothetical protein
MPFAVGRSRPIVTTKGNEMIRKLRAGGLAFFAILLMGAVMASGASATEFTSPELPGGTVSVHGSQAATEPHVFKSDGYETTCQNAEFSGTTTNPSTTATITPIYSECTAFGLGATVHMNGCDYSVTLPEGAATHVQAKVSLLCPPEKEVTITAGGGVCVAHIPPFSKKEHITISNSHPNVTAYITVGGIQASLTDVNGFFCPFSGNTTVQTAEYTGHLTITGTNVNTIDIG